MSDGEALVEVHCVGDGVEAFEGDDGEGEDGQLAGEHPQESATRHPGDVCHLIACFLNSPENIHNKTYIVNTVQQINAFE